MFVFHVLTWCCLILARISWERMVVSPPLWNICDRPAVSLTIDLQAFTKRHICIFIVWDLVCRQQNFVCDTNRTEWRFSPWRIHGCRTLFELQSSRASFQPPIWVDNNKKVVTLEWWVYLSINISLDIWCFRACRAYTWVELLKWGSMICNDCQY